MKRYLLTVEYSGSTFYGWQKQTNLKTVQGVLEEALHKFLGHPVSVFGSSRTDVGVHAIGNTCHVDIARVCKRKPDQPVEPFEPVIVKRAVNHFLQARGEGSNIAVTDVWCVPLDFHARHQAKERTYHYRILAGMQNSSIFEHNRAWHIHESLDLYAMKEASKHLVGYRDFSSFRAAGCQAVSPLKTLDELCITESPYWSHYFPDEKSRNQQTFEAEMPTARTSACVVVTARARSFLYHQVRLLVGVLKAVGAGQLSSNEVIDILEAKCITRTPPMAPADGLFLAQVKYDKP